MAFSAPRQILANAELDGLGTARTERPGFHTPIGDCEVWLITKSSGDTSGNLTTGLERITGGHVYQLDGTLETATTILDSGSGVAAISGIATGQTTIIVVVHGNKRP